MKKFYLATAIPYVNGRPHVGHALEFVQADAITRYYRYKGFDALLLSGSDENGLKIVQAAEKAELTPQELCDQNTQIFQKFAKGLHVEIGEWRRGTDKTLHWPGVWELWKKGEQAGDIYRKKYKGLYCVGCEDFYLPKDLINGKCPEHLREPEVVEEENYFFRLSKYQNQLRELITSDTLKILPSERKNETLGMLDSGLQDFSISRSIQRAKGWGIPVPGDPSQVIYTWYDGLAIYMTGVGFGYDQKTWKKWWPADIHLIGKGINRFHTLYWPAMLLSARLPLPKSVFIHGYITSGGQKMSKTLGNVIDPFDVVSRYGAEATRYYLLKEIPSAKDGDFTYKRFEQVYQADLANGLGNLVQRVAKLSENIEFPVNNKSDADKLSKRIGSLVESFKLNEVLEVIWGKISLLDEYLNNEKPWKLDGDHRRYVLLKIIQGSEEIFSILGIAEVLQPFLPETAAKIQKIFSGPIIVAPKPLFPRLDLSA